MNKYLITKTSTVEISANSKEEALKSAKIYSNSGLFSEEKFDCKLLELNDKNQLNFFDVRIEEGLQLEDIPFED